MVDTAGQNTQNQTPSNVFPLPGWNGTISPHWGVAGNNGGSDLMAPVGQPVVSMTSGKVVFTSTQQTAPTSGGNAIEILGADGLSYYYAHMLNPINLKPGDSVVAGQSLGVVDNTGDAAHTASHLHIGIGNGIITGTGPQGGLGGGGYNAVARLQALETDPRANDPKLADPTATPNPPQIQFVPSVPGFTSANENIIKTIVQEALKLGVDPFIALGIASKESSMDPNAINKSSGACGLFQLYPCYSGFDPQDIVTNIDKGLQTYKDKLSACNGSITCALNNYSGGAGLLYVGDVQSRAQAIQTANPQISSGGFSIPTVGGTVGTPGTGNITTGQIDKEQCPPLSFSVGGGITIPFPDVPCLIRTTIQNMITSLTNWWKEWQTSHIPNWFWVAIGLVLVIVGALALANSAGMQPPSMGSSGSSEGELAKPGFSAEELAVL